MASSKLGARSRIATIESPCRQTGDPDPERSAFHEARRLRRVYREKAVSLAYETVFSHPSGVLDLVRFREWGYQVCLVFVSTDDPELNVARVAGRVRAGGHAVPPDKVRRRYRECLQLLPRMVEEADTAWIFDSTERVRLCARVTGGRVTEEEAPDYLRKALLDALPQRSAARKALREAYQTRGACDTPDEDAGCYAGRMVGEHLPHAYLQELGEGQYVCHDGALLRSPLPMGEWVFLQYCQGVAMVREARGDRGGEKKADL